MSENKIKDLTGATESSDHLLQPSIIEQNQRCKMAEDKRIKELHRLRGALKAKLTIFEKFLTNSIEDIKLFQLKGKRAEAEKIKADFEITQTELESPVSDADIDSEYTM